MAGTAWISGAILIGGNGFIAAFVAGLAFGAIVKGACKFVYEFRKARASSLHQGLLPSAGGGLGSGDVIAHLTWPVFVLILTSLLILRPLAIWISLIGSGASSRTRLFFGWFGPRGLATALFALLVVGGIPTGTRRRHS